MLILNKLIHGIYKLATHNACYGNKRELNIEFPFVVYFFFLIVFAFFDFLLFCFSSDFT